MAYSIQQARDGGHFVFGQAVEPFRDRAGGMLILYAGSLDDCLAYIKKELAAAPTTAGGGDR